MFTSKAFGFNFLATAGSDNFYNSFNFYQLSYRYLPDHVLLFFLYLGKNHCEHAVSHFGRYVVAVNVVGEYQCLLEL